MTSVQDVTGRERTPRAAYRPPRQHPVNPVVLLDVDEVLFPFAHAYDRWLRRCGATGLDPSHLQRYDVPAAAGPDHDALVVAFLTDTDVIAHERLLPTAVAPLQRLAADYRLIACTSRHASEEGPATRAWLETHAPEIQDVVFTRDRRGGPKTTKVEIARRLRAVLLVDDSAEHLRNLPDHCQPLLLQRPPGLPSEPGAVGWEPHLSRLCPT